MLVLIHYNSSDVTLKAQSILNLCLCLFKSEKNNEKKSIRIHLFILSILKTTIRPLH